MKKQQDSPQSVQWKNWVLPVVIAVGAAGAGITGTLLWTQSQSPSPKTVSTEQQIQTPLPDATPGPDGNPAAGTTDSSMHEDHFHEPPATLTVGMTPVETAVTLGNWYYDHERWDVAIQQYEKAIAEGLESPNVRTDLGNSYRFSDQPQKALEQYRLAQQQDPRHEESLFNQGGLYAFSMKEPEKAIEKWNEYIKRFPEGQNVKAARQLIISVQTQ